MLEFHGEEGGAIDENVVDHGAVVSLESVELPAGLMGVEEDVVETKGVVLGGALEIGGNV